MSQRLLLVLLAGFCCLIGLVVITLLITSEQKRKEKWAARQAETIGPYQKPKVSEAPILVLQNQRKRKSTGALTQLHNIFGWREERRSHYPMSLVALIIVMSGPSLLGGLLATKVLGPIGWAAAPALDIFLVRAFLKNRAEKISTQLLQQFPDALSMISRSVRVGVPLGEAIKVVSREGISPTAEEFGKAADGVAIGVDLEVALLEMAERNDITEYRFFATALSLQSQTGGGLTETLDTLADTIRKREAARKRGNALASEAKTSIYVLTALPIVTGVMLYLSSPDYISVLFTTPSGEKLLAVAVFMLGLGLFSMQQIIKRSLS